MKTTMLALVICLAVVFALPAQAVLVVIQTTAAPQQSVTSLTRFQTLGDMMDGMLVKAWFGTVEANATWGDTGVGTGGAFGSGWQLTENGDTFAGTWTLQNSTGLGMTHLRIDAGVGNTLFDRIHEPMLTPDSARGWPFQILSGFGANDIVTATYSGLVSVGGAQPYGDMYRYLDLSFGTPLASGASITFRQDTDNIAVPDAASTSALMSLGLLGLAGIARRFRR